MVLLVGRLVYREGFLHGSPSWEVGIGKGSCMVLLVGRLV